MPRSSSSRQDQTEPHQTRPRTTTIQRNLNQSQRIPRRNPKATFVPLSRPMTATVTSRPRTETEAKKKKGRGSRIWTNPLQRRRPPSPDRTRPPTTDYRPEAVLCRAAPPNEPDRAETKIPSKSHPSQSNETAIRLLLRPTDCQTPYPSQRQHARRTCQTHARDESAKRPPHDNLEVTLA